MVNNGGKQSELDDEEPSWALVRMRPGTDEHAMYLFLLWSYRDVALQARVAPRQVQRTDTGSKVTLDH